jgi:molybdopterin converting factor small subunit
MLTNFGSSPILPGKSTAVRPQTDWGVTMKVEVRSVGLIKMLMGRAVEEVDLAEGATIGGLLAWLREQKGEKMAPYLVEPKDPSGHLPVRIMVNGTEIGALAGIKTTLHEGDEILVFVPILGG